MSSCEQPDMCHYWKKKKKEPHSSGDVKNSLVQRFGQCINVPHRTIFKTDKSYHKLI